MNWLRLESQKELEDILSSDDTDSIIAIFKHSTRCPISSMAKSRIESNWNKYNQDIPIYFLDILKYREISNEIASKLNVEHQSPQLILVKNSKAIYNTSHSAISSKLPFNHN